MEDLKIQILNRIKDSEKQILSIKENASDILDIAYAPGLQKEVTDLLILESKSILNRINNFEINNNGMKRLSEQFPSTSGQKDKAISKISDESMEDISLRPLTLRPQTDKAVIMPSPWIQTMPLVVENQEQIMRELFNLSNTQYRYVDNSGIYPRINFLQDTPPEEIRKWYDFGAINTIYLNTPDFSEIKLLPHWIYEGVKDFYLNNPTISPKDILMIKFFSAGPDFYENKRFPAYHFLQIGKAIPHTINVNEKKEFKRFNEVDIHYRRAIGLRIILQNMENSFKRGFRTYGGKKMHSSVMISPAKRTPEAAQKYLTTKIKWIDSGIIESSPQAQSRLCQFRKHQKDTCPACSAQKTQKDEAGSSTILLFSDSD